MHLKISFKQKNVDPQQNKRSDRIFDRKEKNLFKYLSFKYL